MTANRRAKDDARAESSRTGQPYAKVRRQQRGPGQQHATPVPSQVLDLLIDTFATHEASLLVEEWTIAGARESFVHPGAPFGRVVAWLWRTDRQYAMQTLGEWLAMVRRGVADHDLTPTVTVDDLVAGLRRSLPPTFPDEQRDDLVVAARRELPELVRAWESPA